MSVDRTQSALVERARHGDGAAFADLIQSEYRAAARLAHALLHDLDEAEDAVQESALKAWRKLGNLRAWARKMRSCTTVDLESALRAFEAVETNLQRLAAVWDEMVTIIPQGVSFPGGSPEERRYEELRWAFADIIGGIPGIDGWTITSRPWELAAIAQARLDSWELGEIEITQSTEDGVFKPGDEIAEYRIRLNRARRELVRSRMYSASAPLSRFAPHSVQMPWYFRRSRRRSGAGSEGD
jgi:hypothetical protein